jgi:hypothetical protein
MSSVDRKKNRDLNPTSSIKTAVCFGFIPFPLLLSVSSDSVSHPVSIRHGSRTSNVTHRNYFPRTFFSICCPSKRAGFPRISQFCKCSLWAFFRRGCESHLPKAQAQDTCLTKVQFCSCSQQNSLMHVAGVYFAEVASKSAQYCFPSKKNPTGILLLSEVALGQQLKLSKANYSAKKACQRAGLDSVKGVGRNGPSEATAVHLPGGARLCMGPMASDADFTSGDLLCVHLLPPHPKRIQLSHFPGTLSMSSTISRGAVCDFCCL